MKCVLVNEKDAAIIHICQGEEIVKVLPVQSADSSRRHKWQGGDAATLTHFFLLPVLLLHRLQKGSLSSFKYIVIYLPFFLLSTLALCTTISEAEGEKKENKAKSQGLKAEIFQVARRKMLFYDSLLICAVDSWLQGINGNQTHFNQPVVQSYFYLVQWWVHGYCSSFKAKR